MMNTLAIVGSHSDTRDQVDWLDPELDIWVFNEAAQASWCKRVNGVFQLHEPAVYRNPHNLTNLDHWSWLQQPHPFPIWLQDGDPFISAGVVYPLDAVLDYLSLMTIDGQPVRYFTSTMEYAIALALYLGYRHIQLYGIEVNSNTEYAYQREGVMFWLGFAAGMGARLELHCLTKMFDRPLYAYSGQVEHTVEMFRERIESHKARMNELKPQILPLDFTGDINTQLDERDPLMFEFAKTEGALQEGLKYEWKTRQMLEENGRAVFDRFEFEYGGAKLKDEITHFGALATRSRGWVDASLSVHEQVRTSESLSALTSNIDAHITAQHEYGIRMGALEENMFYQRRWDNMLEAAGGRKTLAAYTPQFVEVSNG